MLSRAALEKLIFYLFLFFLPFDIKKFIARAFNVGSITEFNSFFVYLSDIFIFVLLFLFLVSSFRNRRKFFNNKILLLSLGSFITFSFLSLLNASNPLFALYGITRILLGIFLLLYIGQNISHLSYKLILEIFSVSGVIQACLAIGQYFKQSSLGFHYLGESTLGPHINGVAKISLGQAKLIRSYGTFPHPNILAAFLTISFFSLIVLILKDSQITKKIKTSQRLVKYTALIIIILGLVLTFSRTFVILSLFSLVALWIILHRHHLVYQLSPLRINRIVFSSILVYLALIFIIWPVSLLHVSQSQSLTLRSSYNHEAIQIIKKQPLLGAGFANFINRLFIANPFLPSWEYQPAHNIYLLLLTEIGIFGFLSFLVFLSILIKKALVKIKSRSLEKLAFLIVFFCFLLSGFVDHFLLTINQGILMFWLILSLATGD